MLRIVIADDEKEILELIENLIDESIGAQVVGRAQNGIEALEMVAEYKPEVVITDIRMPGKTGLDLIAEACRISPSTSFIIISGYRKFEYAKTALQYGTVDYLLKPVRKEELNATLLRIASAKKDDHMQKEENEVMKTRLSQNTELLIKNALHDLIGSRSSMAIQKLMTIGVLRECEKYRIAVVVHDDSTGDKKTSDEKGREDIFKTILTRLKRLLMNDGNEVEVLSDNNIGIIFLGYDDRPDYMRSISAAIDEALKNDQYRYDYFCTTVAFGTAVDAPEFLRDSMDSAFLALRSRSDIGLGRTSVYDHIPAGFKCYRIDIPQSEKDSIIAELKNENIDKLNIEIKNVFLRAYFVYKRVSALYDVAEKIVMLIYNYYKEVLPEPEKIDPRSMIDELIYCAAMSGLQAKCISYADNAVREYALQISNARSVPVKTVLSYIEEHYDENISLEQMANMVFLNSSYLSTLFKEEVGENLINYLTTVRIKNACILLKDGRYSVSEVAELVGYKDARYFSKTFSKVMGINPKEYKRFYSR